nr:MAG TPA: Protein of unknown function (DUF739) [Caudoviricetes sp.]
MIAEVSSFQTLKRNGREVWALTDSKLLRDVLRDSGYRLVYVAEACGLTYAGFLKKLNNETEFKASEIMALRRLLQLTDAESNAIFFAPEVH